MNIQHLIHANNVFWRRYVPEAWERLPFDHKLSWIVFGFYTVALLTIIELFLLK